MPGDRSQDAQDAREPRKGSPNRKHNRSRKLTERAKPQQAPQPPPPPPPLQLPEPEDPPPQQPPLLGASISTGASLAS
jgi:hypothetical protein